MPEHFAVHELQKIEKEGERMRHMLSKLTEHFSRALILDLLSITAQVVTRATDTDSVAGNRKRRKSCLWALDTNDHEDDFSPLPIDCRFITHVSKSADIHK